MYLIQKARSYICASRDPRYICELLWLLVHGQTTPFIKFCAMFLKKKEENLTLGTINIDYSLGTSVRAQNGRGLLEEVLKMMNCGTVC